MNLDEKLTALTDLIRSKPSAAVAFSGGVDSTFLTRMVFESLGKNSLALTIDSPFIPKAEIELARQTAKEIGIHHRVIQVDPLPPQVLKNDRQRCYQCKNYLFKLLLKNIKSENIETLFDGSNLDDLSDYRPGMKALRELAIESPLLICQFTKNDIREASRKLGLKTWNYPSLACLATRIPYDTEITNQALSMVEQAEHYLKELGFDQLRVRCHTNLARIEVDPAQISRFFDDELISRINARFKTIGFKYVSLDLEGYQSGKMNDNR